MPDTADLIRRARELANSYPHYNFSDEARLALMLLEVTDELERIRSENARLRASTMYECPKCRATCMGKD